MNDYSSKNPRSYTRGLYQTKSEDEAGARAGSPHAIACLLRRSLGPSASEYGNYAYRQIQAIEYNKLAEFLDKVLPPNYLHRAQLLTIGGEHEVYLIGNRVFKITRDDEAFDYGTGIRLDYETIPHQYLERFAIANELFGDDIVWEGVIQMGNHIRTVTSQPFYFGVTSSEEELNDKLVDLGFNYHEILSSTPGYPPDQLWYRRADNVLIGDTKAANFVKTPIGIRPIDVIAEISSNHF